MQKRLMLLLLSLITLFPQTAIPDEEKPVRVSYLGPRGTYTEEAAQYWFRHGEALVAMNTVQDAVAVLLHGEADYAVIPQENTLGGAVLNYVDALISAEEVYVTGEIILPISQTLMGVPGTSIEDIRTIYSHAQGLTQSKQWREMNLPEADTVETASTAAAASYVAEQNQKNIAAIAAPGAAQLYGLEILATDVQVTDSNKTRFYVLSKEALSDERLPRAVFVITCDASRIDDIIVEIHHTGLEMVCLHDRPEGSFLGSYHYVIEVEDPAGITDAQIETIAAWDGVRFAGRFQTIQKTAQAEVLLVNADHPLPDDFVPAELVNLYEQKRHFLLANSSIELEREAFDAANRMFRLAEEEDMNGFILTSGYRTRERQAQIYAESPDTAQTPGSSEHETGLAFDVTTRYDHGTFEDTPQFAWLYEHCWDFGFILRYPAGKESVTGIPYESWHYRYVGEDIARVIRENGWTLEEYCDHMSAAEDRAD